MNTFIRLHLQAPEKPPLHAPCNGCGVCCASEPCPLGMVVSRRRYGACRALHWSAAESRYLCGLIAEPRQYLPRHLGWLASCLRRFARRAVAAGKGCDADISVIS